jgi:glycosyltransferase involved in cell wall biosynthesis
MHEYRSFQNIFACYYAKQNAVPYILQAHGSLEKINKSRIKSFYDLTFGYDMLKNASGVIALTEVEAKQYIDMGASNEKIVVVPNGIDLSEYATLPSKGLFKKKFNIADNKKIILYLGRINKVKGIDFLVESYSYLINKINFKDVVLVIAGPDDGYLSDLKNLIYSLKLDDYVLLTGMLSKEDKISAFRDSDVCAYLNPIEPFGLVPLESAVSMTPVIVIDGTPMAKIVKEGEFGLTTNYGDVNALANIFKDILQDENFTQKMGICGRKYVSSNFNWSQIILKLEKMYEDVIKGYSYQRSNI